MLKAYIIKSRVRVSEKLLLAQPYSPHLFQQGVLPGPELLLGVLTGKITHTDAKAAWKSLEKEKKKKEKKVTAGGWLLEQTLPCRRCTDRSEDGQEVWKAISSFATSVATDELFANVLSKGQDAICVRCRHELGETMSEAVLPCDGCGVIKMRGKFDEKEVQK